MGSNTVKVLIAGDVNGKLEALYKRVSTVNASNGPFDVLLCVGSFFPASGSDDAEHPGELLPYLQGAKKAPLPTYFIGGYGLGSKTSLAALAAAPECDIFYLGRSGISTIKGLSIAYLDGTYNAAAFQEEGDPKAVGCRYYHEADVALLKNKIDASGDIDFLLTNEWPAGVCAGLPDGSLPTLPAGQRIDGASPCADVALASRPRYHIAAGKHTFFARIPYINVDLGAGSHVTRFISLGDVGNTTKQKWIHALAVSPAVDMTPEVLQTVPQGSTGCPYTSAANQRKRPAAQAADEEEDELGTQSWRWQQQGKRPRAPIAAPSLGRPDVEKDRSKSVFVRNVPFRATEEDIVAFFTQAGHVVDVVRRANAEGKLNTYCHIQFASKEEMEAACQLNGTQLMGRPLFIDPAAEKEARKAPEVKPVEGCWFCLSNPNADVELVVSIGEECYVASDKGAITDHHVLVLPVEHFPCSLAMPASAYAEMDRYFSALRSCFAAAGKQTIMFERYMKLKKSGGNHCHFNVIAVPTAAAEKAEQVFTSLAGKHGFTLKHVPAAVTGEAARDAVRAVVGHGEYFVAVLPDGSRLVHPIVYGERHPLSYGREVLAELAGVPEKADWKNCGTSQEEGIARTERFKAAFKMYDIMTQDS